MSNCAECTSKACRRGSKESVPSNCPSLSHSKEMMIGLYSAADKKGSHNSALVEAEGYCQNTRLEEIMDYSYKMGYRHLGVAFCVGLSEEGRILCQVLRDNGFEVDSVCCKTCCIPKSEIGISKEQHVRKNNDYEGMCNPVGQAYILDEQGIDFAIVLGLCVGHDTLFFKNIKAPCTVLSAKDRALGHNPMSALYLANSYMVRQHDFIKIKYGEDAWNKMNK